MGCDYYIQSKLVIEYLDEADLLCVIYTDLRVKGAYVLKCADYNYNDDMATFTQKFRAELNKEIEKNNYETILFENDLWLKDIYKQTYESRIKREFKQILKLKKIYKKFTAWENN